MSDELEAIRERDAADWPTVDALEELARTIDDAELRNAIHMVRDRRALLAYVDALREAAGRVTCMDCEGTGRVFRGNEYVDCPDCSDLRRLLALGRTSDQPEDAGQR